MKKRLLTIILLYMINPISYGQELTVDETISYINNLISEKGKISLNKDGTFEYFNYNNSNSLYLINNNQQATYKAYIFDLSVYDKTEEPREMFGSMNTWHVYVSCKELKPYDTILNLYTAVECMKILYPDNTKKNVSHFDLYTNDEDKNSTAKLLNSFSYLLSKAKEDGHFERTDNDPFSSNNYNPRASDIKSVGSTETIKLEKQNEVYYIWITVGNLKRKFVLDSGASDVLLSEEMEKDLITANIIKKTDYITPALYRIADGSIIKCRRLILPELKIGNFIVKNVKASIGVSNISLLLGKSLLDKFKKWTIDNLSETLNLEK